MHVNLNILRQSLRWTATFPIVTWLLAFVVMIAEEPATQMSRAGGFEVDLCRAFIHDDRLPDDVVALKKTAVQFRNAMESGPGGKQIQIEDPDGNPVELFEPAGR